MADKTFERLKKEVEKKVALTEEITIKISSVELEILKKKAALLGIEIEELVREFLVDSSAFDVSVFTEKKLKNKVNEVAK